MHVAFLKSISTICTYASLISSTVANPLQIKTLLHFKSLRNILTLFLQVMYCFSQHVGLLFPALFVGSFKYLGLISWISQ